MREEGKEPLGKINLYYWGNQIVWLRIMAIAGIMGAVTLLAVFFYNSYDEIGRGRRIHDDELLRGMFLFFFGCLILLWSIVLLKYIAIFKRYVDSADNALLHKALSYRKTALILGVIVFGIVGIIGLMITFYYIASEYLR